MADLTQAEAQGAAPMRRIVFDVESIGLHGEGFAVGWVVLDAAGREESYGGAACFPETAQGTDDDRAWIAANVVPALREGPGLAFCDTPRGVRDSFWSFYQGLKAAGPVELWADCPWPVEARFLHACVDDDQSARCWEGPYPLLDVGVMVRASGLDGMATFPRLAREEPAHHPLCDSLQSARLLLETEDRLMSTTKQLVGG